MITKITIQGEPVAMQRPRVARGRAYNPQAALKRTAQMEVKAQWYVAPANGTIALDLNFYVGKDNKDLDNMIKWVGDILQGVVFKNDLAVQTIWAYKWKSENPRTIISIYHSSRS